jgi:UDPglucose 6-dehydrogenase
MAWNNPRVRVAIVDRNKQLIQSWEEASSTMTLPIPEPGLYKLLSGARQNSNIHFSTNLQEEIDNAQMLFICVDTPLQVPLTLNLPFYC